MGKWLYHEERSAAETEEGWLAMDGVRPEVAQGIVEQHNAEIAFLEGRLASAQQRANQAIGECAGVRQAVAPLLEVLSDRPDGLLRQCALSVAGKLCSRDLGADVLAALRHCERVLSGLPIFRADEVPPLIVELRELLGTE